MHKRRMDGKQLWFAVARRTAALCLAGFTVWGLWLTADFRAVGDAVRQLGENAELAVAVLTAELGKPAEDGTLVGLTGWDKLVLGQSAFLMGGKESVAALAAGELNVEEPPPSRL